MKRSFGLRFCYHAFVKTYHSKLIVLRGNSGSGKSSTARAVREASKNKIAVVEQDYLRRIVLKEKEADNGDNIELIEQVTLFALSKGYHVILEGILYFPRYGKMLERLSNVCPNNYFYYFDVSLEETLRRHAYKPNAHEFGEKEMGAWFQKNDLTHFKNEKIILESMPLSEIVDLIISDSGL